MRFVLVGLSAAVALLVALNTSWSEVEAVRAEKHTDDDVDSRSEDTSTCSEGVCNSATTVAKYLATFRDMATGRYLYDFFLSHRRVKAA